MVWGNTVEHILCLIVHYHHFQNTDWNKYDDRLMKAVERGEVDKVAAVLSKKGIIPTKLDVEGRSAWVNTDTPRYTDTHRHTRTFTPMSSMLTFVVKEMWISTSHFQQIRQIRHELFIELNLYRMYVSNIFVCLHTLVLVFSWLLLSTMPFWIFANLKKLFITNSKHWSGHPTTHSWQCFPDKASVDGNCFTIRSLFLKNSFTSYLLLWHQCQVSQHDPQEQKKKNNPSPSKKFLWLWWPCCTFQP